MVTASARLGGTLVVLMGVERRAELADRMIAEGLAADTPVAVVIDATTPEEVWREVSAMLRTSPEPDAEEWAIHDYEGFEGAYLSEYASFETVCELAEFIGEHGELAACIYGHYGNDLEQARAAFGDYAGEYRSAADFAEELHDDRGPALPESLRYYLDWQALARDMALNGEIMVFQTGFDEVHIFWSR
jgi:antirestriction protein